MRKKRMVDIIKVVRFLRDNPNTHLREIARSLDMNVAVVHRTLKDISDFIITKSVNAEIDMNLPNMPVMVRLKDGVTEEGIIKFLNVKKKLAEMKRE